MFVLLSAVALSALGGGGPTVRLRADQLSAQLVPTGGVMPVAHAAGNSSSISLDSFRSPLPCSSGFQKLAPQDPCTDIDECSPAGKVALRDCNGVPFGDEQVS